MIAFATEKSCTEESKIGIILKLKLGDVKFYYFIDWTLFLQSNHWLQNEPMFVKK